MSACANNGDCQHLPSDETTPGRISNPLSLQISTVAKRKTLFDDRPVEISELTYIIKRDIASLNGKIARLQGIVTSNSGIKGKQVDEHNNNVLVMLQGKLATTSMGFKDVLEIRTQNMKASKNRTEQFGYTSQNATSTAPSTGECRLFCMINGSGMSIIHMCHF